MDEREVRRMTQLEEGIAGAAAALPGVHEEVAARAVAAARRVVARAGSAQASDDPVGPLERLHYALLRVAVLGESPEETGLEGALAEAEDLAGAMEDETPAAMSGE